MRISLFLLIGICQSRLTDKHKYRKPESFYQAEEFPEFPEFVTIRYEDGKVGGGQLSEPFKLGKIFITKG